MPTPLYYDPQLDLTVLWVDWDEIGIAQSYRDIIAARVSDPISGKTTVQVHHTAGIDDDDSTPNMWDLDEACAYMRKLQWSRPELGPLPYSENIAVSEDLNTVWILQGRGLSKRGAHTAGHNVDGVGWGYLANFDKTTPPRCLSVALRALELRVSDLRNGKGFVNLGSEPSPNGWPVWGHRDTAAKSCPGNNFYPLLENFRLEVDMKNIVPEEFEVGTQEGVDDVLVSAWNWGTANGIVSVYTDPDKQMTNEEFVVLLKRYHDHVVAKLPVGGDKVFGVPVVISEA